MSVDGARAARCSNNADAICGARDFHAPTLAGCSEILAMTQKPAWLNGFRVIAILTRTSETKSRRENFRIDSRTPARRHDALRYTKFFFTGSRRKRAQTRNRVALGRIRARVI